MAVVRVAVILCDSCPMWQFSGWQLSWVAIILGGNYSRRQLSWVAIVLGSSCPRCQLPGWQLSRVAIVLGGSCPMCQLFGRQLSGGSCPGDYCPRTNLLSYVSKPTIWQIFLTQYAYSSTRTPLILCVIALNLNYQRSTLG